MPSWPEPVERVAAALKTAAVDARVEEFPAGTPTARDAAAAAGCELSQEVLHATGFEPGAVAPFPQRAVTRTLMDKGFFRHPVVWIGAGSPAHMAALPPAELQRLSRASLIDLAPHG